LVEQISILHSAAVESSKSKKELIANAGGTIQSLLGLEKQNLKLQSELSLCLERSKKEFQSWNQEQGMMKKELRNAKAQVQRLRKKCNMAAVHREHAVTKAKEQLLKQKATHKLLKKGVYTKDTRNLIRFLVNAGCLKDYVGQVIAAVLKCAGITAIGALSRRTVSRVLVEGWVASQIQTGFELLESKGKLSSIQNLSPTHGTLLGVTFSADGTSHRNINYNSRHVNLKVEDYDANDGSQKRATRFLGVMSSLDGTSEQSLKDWDNTLATIADIFNRSPMGKRYGQLLRTVDIFSKLAGMLTDHCAKEKKDVATLEKKKIEAMYQKLGEDIILGSENQELMPKFLDSYKQMVKDLGGQNKWNGLPEEDKKERIAKMTEGVVIDLGKDAYEMLSDSEKKTLKLFIWAGCGCHKDLNTVKAGYAEMASWWEENEIQPPVLLANRDNAAVLNEISSEQGTVTPAQERAFEMTSRGAIKATQLAGAIFNHKDDKKGHHNVFRYWWKDHVKTDFTFPDTSNTRFQSHCEAAGALLLHLNSFIQYLEFARKKKQKQNFSHMEQNLWDALHCTSTLTELAVLALYSQSVSHPYMRAICTPGAETNMLDLGPLHHKLSGHIKHIIARPELLIGHDASYEKGAMDGQKWQSSLIMSAIQAKMPELPHLKPLLVKFFQGAAKGWKRFTSEFAPGGLIDEATLEEKDLAWLPTTNDVNEGALGSFRVLMRRQPQLTVLHYNAQAMFHHNETQAFMDAKFNDPEDFRFLHSEARKLKGADKKRHLEIIQYNEAKIEQKQAASKKKKDKIARKAAEIAKIRLILDRNAVVKLAGEKLRDHFAAFKAAGAPNVQNMATREKVTEIRKALQQAVDLYNEGKWDPYNGSGDGDEEESDGGEVFNLADIEEDEEEEWEDV
jgi:hypothetical protein